MKKTRGLFQPIMIFIALCSFTFALYSCKKETEDKAKIVSDFNLDNAKTEIEAVNKTFMDLVAKSDSAGISNLYAKDAKVMFAGGPSVMGKENIQKMFSGILKSGVTSVDIKTVEVMGNEDLLAEESLVTIFVKDKAVEEDKAIVIWKKEDGKWKLFRDIMSPNSKP